MALVCPDVILYHLHLHKFIEVLFELGNLLIQCGEVVTLLILTLTQETFDAVTFRGGHGDRYQDESVFDNIAKHFLICFVVDVFNVLL